jgi:hypothetical protein
MELQRRASLSHVVSGREPGGAWRTAGAVVLRVPARFMQTRCGSTQKHAAPVPPEPHLLARKHAHQRAAAAVPGRQQPALLVARGSHQRPARPILAAAAAPALLAGQRRRQRARPVGLGGSQHPGAQARPQRSPQLVLRRRGRIRRQQAPPPLLVRLALALVWHRARPEGRQLGARRGPERGELLRAKAGAAKQPSPAGVPRGGGAASPQVGEQLRERGVQAVLRPVLELREGGRAGQTGGWELPSHRASRFGLWCMW